MSSFHNAIDDPLSPLQGENSSMFDYGGFIGGFGQNGDYYDQHPDELPQSQRPPTEESQRPDASLPGGDTQMLQYALGGQISTSKHPTVGPSGTHAGLNGSQASLEALESQVPNFRSKTHFPRKKITSSPPDPNWKMPSNLLNLHETPQRTPSYPSLPSNSNHQPNYEQASIIQTSSIFSESNGGLQDPTDMLESSYDAGVPTSQPFAFAPVASSPAGRLLAFSPILKRHGTQTLVHATPSPLRVRPQSSSSTVPAPAPVGDTTAPPAPNALPLMPALASGAVLTLQETDVLPETPQSDQDPQQAHQRTPTAAPPLTRPVVGHQESFVIPEPQAEMYQVPDPSPRKRSAPDDFEGPPTPTKKTRRLYNANQNSARLKPMVVVTRAGAIRGRQEATSPAKSRPSSRKQPARNSSPSKAIVTPRISMWDETLDDGFGKKAAETATRAKKPTKLPARRLSDFEESQLVPIAVITPSGKTKPIIHPESNPKKRAPKEVAEHASPKKGKGRAAAQTAALSKTQLGESEPTKVDRRKPSTRSKAATKDITSPRRAGKLKLGATIEPVAVSQEEDSVETSRMRNAARRLKSNKDASPNSNATQALAFKLDPPTRKGQKRKIDEAEEGGPSSGAPPRKKRKAPPAEEEAPIPSKPSRKRQTGLNTDADIPKLPSKERRNAPMTIDEESSARATHIKANTIPLASVPLAQSFAETTSSLRSASQAPNRVFAKWGGDGMYYCGTLKRMGKGKDGVRVCTVEYDDGEVAQVTLEGLRRCEVWVGDVVEIPAAKGKIRKSATVASVDEWEEHRRVRVSVAKGRGKSTARAEEVNIQSSDVSVPATQVEADMSWNNRRISVEDLEERVPVDERNYEDGDESYRDELEGTTQETSDLANASHSKAVSGTRRTTRTVVGPAPVSKSAAPSTRRTPRVREGPHNAVATSRIDQQLALPFVGDAFLIAITLSDKERGRTKSDKEREQTKERLQDRIISQGGVCIEDWDELLQIQGTLDVDERRWIWEKSEDINYSRMQSRRGPTRKGSNIDRVWVLADEPNNNAKYFTALALGVPCVGSKWVEDGAKYPWSSYLLPTGHSSVLGQECVQIVNYDHADHPRTIKQLIDNPGSVRKPFAGKSLLWVCTSDKKGKISEADFEKKLALPVIACLMGPARVEVVHDIKHKSLDILGYDIIIWDTPPAAFVKTHSRSDVIIADVPWVKECLLTGALLEV